MRNLRWTWWNGEIGFRDLSARVGNQGKVVAAREWEAR